MSLRSDPLLLDQFEPKSMLQVEESSVPFPKYPVIDFHTHITWSGGLSGEDKVTFTAPVDEIRPVIERKNVKTLVNLTAGYAEGLNEALGTLKAPHFIHFTEPHWTEIQRADYPKFQADQIEAAHQAGAKGIKVLKTLGLYLREQVTIGKLVPVDDSRFDPMWETAAALKLPVAIHSSDPRAFFMPIDRFNERWEELHEHPDWSFHGKDFPSNRELQEARVRVMKRHPRTQFVCLHVADAEDLAFVSECMDAYPNMWVDIAARINELGRQPRASRKFFDRYQDRILFGTDAVPNGYDYPQQIFGEALYEIYYRFLETEDEYFDYAPARVPPQGRWRIYGLGLPDGILKKIYWQNAARLLHI